MTETSLFEGIDTTWTRVEHAKRRIAPSIDSIPAAIAAVSGRSIPTLQKRRSSRSDALGSS